MKRRVARDHSNKRVLRSLSARHAFSHDAFHVLCDASFLRALLQLPECSPFSRGKQKEGPHSSPSNASSGASHHSLSQDPFQVLKTLTLQSLDVLDRQSMKGKDKSGGKLTKQLSRIQWTYLPSTARVLKSMCDHRDKSDNTQGPNGKQRGPSSSDGNLLLSSVKRLLSNLHVIGEQRPEISSSVPSESNEAQTEEAVTPGRTPSLDVNHFLSPEANEAKAIESFVLHHQKRRHQSRMGNTPSSTSSTALAPLVGGPVLMERSIFLFVATQSHDVRRRLPEDAALLRLTHHPTAMWVEIRGEHYSYDTDTNATRKHHPQDKRVNQGRNREGANNNDNTNTNNKNRGILTPSRGPKISPADLAFLRHLGKDVVNPSETTQNGNSSHASSISSNTVTNNNSTESKSERATPIRRKRKAEAHPNPLAVKKKQKKEVIRL